MTELLAGPALFDLVIAVLVLEAVLLLAWRGFSGGGVPAADLLPPVLSGLCLLLAFRIWLGEGAWPWVALSLLVALAAHLFDLRRRWRSASQP